MNHIANDNLKQNIHKKLKTTFEKTIDNPMLKAQLSWDILSDQLEAILGIEIHTQWFKSIQPLVLKNNILLLQTQNQFASHWINTHYQQLVDALLMIQDPKFTCFFISPRKI